MIITFLGHRLVPPGDRLIPRIKDVLLSRIGDTDEVTFYCGGYGDFDRLCAQVCRSIKKDRGRCELVYITPYITEAQQKKVAAFLDDGLYDSVLYPPLEHIPPRFSILHRNEWMVSNADTVLAYVRTSYGGAYRGLLYAKKLGKDIINLAESR